MPPKKKVETKEEPKEPKEPKEEANEETKLNNLKQKFKENKKKVKEEKKKEKEEKKKDKGEKKKQNTIKQTAKGSKTKSATKSTGKSATKSTGKNKVKKAKKQVKGNETPDTVLEDNEDNLMDNTTFKSDYREIINTYNPSNNKTNNIMTIYEAALIIGKRTTQITYGAEPVIEYSETDTPESIAIRELVTKKIPYIIKREINNVIEYWKIDDMELDEEAISIYD